MNLEERIERLSIDRAFGILTRNALELKVEDTFKGEKISVAFVDFYNVRGMNKSVGYEAVNKNFRSYFNKISERLPYLIIGRWFSGDEIVVVSDEWCDLDEVIRVMEIVAKDFNLKFRFRLTKDISVMDERISSYF